MRDLVRLDWLEIGTGCFALRFTWDWWNVGGLPSMLPSVICLTAFALMPPRLVTMGACASFRYCVNDQSLGLDELVIGFEELSRRRGLRRWWERML